MDRELQIPAGDGRTLAVRDLGHPEDPVVLFHPGFMASRLTARPAARVRIITIDRPGVGGSSSLPGRHLLDWPRDVEAVVDQLAVERFGVLGHSAGGPYAAACACGLGERVTALGIACGFAPFDRPDSTAGMNQRMAKAVPALRRAPWLARLVTQQLPRRYRRDPARAFEQQFGRDLPASDRAALADPDAMRSLLDSAVESTRQGASGLATEMRILFSWPWGFSPREITTPTTLWYGADDTLTPPAAGEFLHGEIAGSRLTVFPAEGHMAAFTHWDQIVSSVVAACV